MAHLTASQAPSPGETSSVKYLASTLQGLSPSFPTYPFLHWFHIQASELRIHDDIQMEKLRHNHVPEGSIILMILNKLANMY